MFVPLEEILEEWTWCCQDHLVDFQLVTILAYQGDISKVNFIPETCKGSADIICEVIPLKAEFLRHCSLINWQQLIVEQIYRLIFEYIKNLNCSIFFSKIGNVSKGGRKLGKGWMSLLNGFPSLLTGPPQTIWVQAPCIIAQLEYFARIYHSRNISQQEYTTSEI